MQKRKYAASPRIIGSQFAYSCTISLYIIYIPIDGLEDHGFYFYFQKVGRKVPITGSRIEKEGRVSAGHGD